MPNLMLNRLFVFLKENSFYVVSPFLVHVCLGGTIEARLFHAYSRFKPRQLLLQFRAVVKALAHRCRDALNSAEQVDRKATPEAR